MGVQTPDYEMKHRICGAVILVTVAVVVLPWLLSQSSGEAEAVVPQSSGLDLGGFSLNAAESIPQTESPQQNPAPDAAQITNAEATRQPNNPACTDPMWRVHAGVFKRKDNVNWVVEALKQGDYAVHTQLINNLLGGSGTLVWVGPYDNEGDAQAAKARLKSITGEVGYLRKIANQVC